MRSIVGALALTAVLILPRAGLTWSEAGHQVIARIAHTNLDPIARDHVDTLLKQHPDERARDFIGASTWPDLVRREEGKYSSWHFINLPIYAGVPASSSQPAGENAVWALNQCVRTLRSDSASPAEKAEKLSLLMHVTGDIHQPLHCATRVSAARPKGDRGGNDFPIRDVRSSKNLHVFWDGGLGQFEAVQPRFLDGSLPPLEQLALEVISDYPRSVLEDMKETDFRKWAEEGRTLARSYAYGSLREGASPPPAYVSKARPVARKRVALAGYRLAALLNRLYGGP